MENCLNNQTPLLSFRPHDLLGTEKSPVTQLVLLVIEFRASGEMVYTKDLKSFAVKACGFESHLAHQQKSLYESTDFVVGRKRTKLKN